MQRAWLLVAALSWGCASAPRVPAFDLSALAAADARFFEGCYDCLTEARDGYARLAVGPYRQAVLPKLFEAELLVAARQRELALDPVPALSRARALASELPATLDPLRYVTIVEGLPADGLGWPRSEIRDLARSTPELLGNVASFLTFLSDSTLREPTRLYLALSLDCSFSPRGAAEREMRDALRDRVTTDLRPLVRYRAASCWNEADNLARLRADVPAFVDTSYGRARAALSDIPLGGGAGAREQIEELLAKFPESPAVLHLAGNYHRTVGDYGAALTFYDRVLAMKPRHDDVWLGRAISFTMLERRAEAIAAATHILDEELDNPGEALYWRALNQRIEGRLDLARADIDRARTLRSSPEIYTLAGMIEHDQDDLDPALRDLRRVLAIPRQSDVNCTALWYLGSVQAKRSSWADAATAFEGAVGCYEGAVARTEDRLTTLRLDEGMNPTYRATQTAALEQVLASDKRQVYASALNAAKFFAVSGNFEKAVPLAERASGEPALAEDLATVREYIAARRAP